MAGVTLNVSRTGLIASFAGIRPPAFTPRVGQPARILLELPQAVATETRCVECRGRIVRIGQCEDSQNVAFEFGRVNFRSLASASLDAADSLVDLVESGTLQ